MSSNQNRRQPSKSHRGSFPLPPEPANIASHNWLPDAAAPIKKVIKNRRGKK